MEQAGAKRLALVVEDDDQIAYLLRYILEREGFAVQLARDGRSAQRQIGNLAPPDLVMLDVMLPDVDGFQLLALIRQQSDWKNVPVLMLTAKSQEKDVARARDAGANDYIFKPFKPDDLRARIRQLVNYGS
jgi:DNA-binding response OmpR family regulator